MLQNIVFASNGVSFGCYSALLAMLWQDQGLSHDSNHFTCSKFIQRLNLTLFLWMIILPWQPLLVICPCRRVLPKTKWLVFPVPEYLAICFAVSHIFMYAMTHVTSHSFFADAPLGDDWFGIFHNETCTFVDTHHFHWMIARPDIFLTPNAFTYFAIWSTCLFARPPAFAALSQVAMPVIFYYNCSTLVIRSKPGRSGACLRYFATCICSSNPIYGLAKIPQRRTRNGLCSLTPI